MTAMEVRGYKEVCKKLVEAEERTKMLSVLLKNGVCLAEDEEFSRSNDKKFRVLHNKRGVMDKKRQEMVDFNLKYKIT